MSDRRPFPPSPRRLALARASGMSAASPVVVGGIAASVAALAVLQLGRSAAGRLAAWISHACAAAGEPTTTATPDFVGHGASAAAGAHGDGAASSPIEMLARVPRAVLELVLPLLAAIAIAAVVAHVAQTRTFWFPRRRLPGAPSLPRRSRIGFELLAAVAIGATSVGWLWTMAPRLARLVEVPGAAALALITFVVTLAIAWVVLGGLDAVLRRRDVDEALAMTRDEKREDDRLSAADPRWAAQRRTLLRGGATRSGVSVAGMFEGAADVAAAVARSAVVLVGDDRAVAIEWDAKRHPVPLRAASARGHRATQLVALARRHRVHVHVDELLARALADGDGAVPQAHWARLAEIIAALRGR